ncbi:amidohydrolase family protein [Cucumibacter marinus]|uniref:amidohydrolase family protein n=1 Tax=Cucumibacter marinus TaxID=1121252 RepID=UPI0004084306|nr:amidohydrolase family protein [Cucumibacter marinus]
MPDKNLPDLVIDGARPWNQAEAVSIAIQGGRITGFGAAQDVLGGTRIDLGNMAVYPAFVEPHIHLDKALTQTRGRARSISEAASISRDVLRDGEALEGRVSILLSELVRHGVCAVRSHVNVGPGYGPETIDRIIRAAAPYRDKIELQLVAFAGSDVKPGASTWRNVARAIEQGCIAIGGGTSRRADPGPFVTQVFDLAGEKGCDVDLHVDEHLEPHCHGLEAVLNEMHRSGFSGRVTVGHCCSLGVVPPSHRSELIEQLRELDVTVIALPLTNLFLQGRSDAGLSNAFPSPRGVTPVRELVAAGVRVITGSDNIQDPYLPYGNGDPMIALMVLGIAAQLTEPAELDCLRTAMTSSAATTLGLKRYGLEVGCKADLVGFDQPSFAHTFTMPLSRQLVVLGGNLVVGDPQRGSP